MPGTSRQLAEAHGPQIPAQRLFADRDAEFLEHPLRQVDQPPAYDAMDRRDRAGLDDRHQRTALFGVQQRRVAGRLAVDETGRTIRVEGQHPIAHRLEADAADPRRGCSRGAIIDRRQRQQPTRLAGIHRPPRQLVQSSSVVIPSKPNRSRHGKPHPVCHGESYSRQFGNPLRESHSQGFGIRPAYDQDPELRRDRLEPLGNVVTVTVQQSGATEGGLVVDIGDLLDAKQAEREEPAVGALLGCIAERRSGSLALPPTSLCASDCRSITIPSTG